MTIVSQGALSPATPEKALQDIMCDCHRAIQPTDADDCASLGEKKHECCDNAIKSHKPPPEIGGEQGYGKNGVLQSQTRKQMKAAGTLTGTLWPDACAMSNGKPTQFFDFKFICPDGVRCYDKHTGKVWISRGEGAADANFYFPNGSSQYDKYRRLGKKLNPKLTRDPVPLTSRSCR